MNRILIIGFVLPEPNSSAAGSRMMGLIHFFLQQNWHITFACQAADNTRTINLETLGIERVHIQVNDPSFDIFIKQLQPSVVLFDRFTMEEQFGWRVLKHCPNALRILDTEDLHSLRKTREKLHKKGKPFNISDLLQSEIAKREIASIYRCDISLIISSFEMEILTKCFKIQKDILFYLPFLLEPITPETKKDWPDFEERNHFVTIGNFRHEPNWDSVLYLKETIWPIIHKQFYEAQLHIYGAYPPPKATQLHNPKQGFHIKGWAENAQQIMKTARVCLAPLRFGAGIKGKLAEAMLCGTPSITTTIGAEGMQGDSNECDWNGFITDDPDKIAQAAIHLYNNKNTWQQAQQNGIEIINTQFSKEKYTNQLIDRILKTKENLESHRTSNFVGVMLQHHSMRSTEYMSRWIEEKNK